MTAALLATYVQGSATYTQKLIEATNWGTTGATLDATILAEAAQEAVDMFPIEGFGTWNPTVVAWHYAVGARLLLKLLWSRTDNENEAQKYENQLAPLLQKLRASRTITPSTTNTTTPTQIVEGTKPAFDRRVFDGYVAGPGPTLAPDNDA